MKEFKNEPGELLKKATRFKANGDYDKAIEYLKKAYKAIPKGFFSYTVETFLRLPMYLQEANRSEEAWNELSLLLKRGYPRQDKDPKILPMEQSKIYDKMRLFLQREGEYTSAIISGIYSYVTWCIGLYRQNRKGEYNDLLDRENIEYEIKKLLKKAKKLEKLNKVVDIVETHLQTIPNVKYNILNKQVSEIIEE